MSRYKNLKSGAITASYSHHAIPCGMTVSIHLPNYKQQDYHSCGFLAALTVAKYFIPEISALEVLEAVEPRIGEGTNQKRMIRGLNSLGVVTEYDDTLTPIILRKYVKQGTPVIISVWPDNWDGDHWCVVRGFTEVYIPPSNKRVSRTIHLTNHYDMNIKQFIREWIHNWGDGSRTGAGLICSIK